MARVKIFVDTSADMSREIAEKYDIDIINFLCIFGEESYVAGEELSNDEFYEKLISSSELPKTSQTPPAVMYEKLSEAAKEYDTVVFFTISSKASGQYNNARMNAEAVMEENPDADIRIIDTMSFSAYISDTAVYFRTLLNSGVSVDEALEKAKRSLASWQCYILVDSLKFLEKGGRITKTASIVGSILDIKPVLTVANGLIEPLEKIRGKKKIYNKLIELIRDNPDFDDEKKEFMVVESNKDYGDKMTELLKEEFGIQDIKMRTEIGPIVGTHIGNGALAVLFRKKGYEI